MATQTDACSIRELEGLLAKRRSELEGLVAMRARAQARVEELDARITFIENGKHAKPQPEPVEPEAEPSSLREFAHRAMVRSGEPMRAAELLVALKGEGVKMPRRAIHNLQTTLSQNPKMFKRISRGLYCAIS